MLNGFININKPDSMTSFQVVSFLKRKLSQKKIGHLGTLDPAGCGVLPIALGKATKLFDYFLDKKKIYRAYFKFGIETDTLDSEGVVVKKDDRIVSENEIIDVIPEILGNYEQLPPKYSAKSINGQRAYELARNNIEFELKTKNVTVYRCDLISKISTNLFLFEIECSSGCYIRSICRDIAYKLNTIAYMPLIIRLQSGIFKIENSVSLQELDNEVDFSKFILKIENCLDLEKVFLNEIQTKKVKNGISIKYDTKTDNHYLLFDSTGELFALGVICNGVLKMEKYLSD